MNWDMWAFLLRFIGFLLIAVGAIVDVAAGTPGGSLYNSPSASTYNNAVQGWANGVLAARLLVALGALALGTGAGIKLRFVLRAPVGAASEQFAWVLIERLVNYVILGFSIVVLLWLLMQVGAPGWTAPTATTTTFLGTF